MGAVHIQCGLLNGNSNQVCLEDGLEKRIPDYSAYPQQILMHVPDVGSLPFGLVVDVHRKVVFQQQKLKGNLLENGSSNDR